MKKQNIEVEGGEILIQSKEGHYAVIPAKHRQEVMDMVKDGCDDCINNYIQSLPKESDYAEDGSLLPDWNKVKATLNPKNWGVSDYSDKGDFDNAYRTARQSREKEFMWNNKRYNTNYKGTPQQQLKETGITDAQLQTQNIIKKRLYNNLNPEGYDNPVNRVYSALIKNKSDKNPNLPEKRQDSYNLYMGHPQNNNTFSISKYKPSINTDDIDYFNIKDREFMFDYLRRAYEKEERLGKEKYSYKEVTTDPNYIMGNFTRDLGEDEHGKYFSYYDKWDIYPIDFGKPFEIYDRFYYKENPNFGKGDTRKYIQQYYSDKELSELDVNKKNFDTLGLQRELSNRGYKLPKSTKEDGTFDGVLGDETKNALLDYQTKNKKK